MPLKVKLSSTPIKYNAKAFEVGRDHIYTTNKARYSQSIHPMVSQDANTCVMLGLNGGNNTDCLMHLAPELQPIRTLRTGLAKCIETLREKMKNMEDNITGILIGGRHSGHKDSFNLFNEVMKVLDEFGIPFSMICGKFDDIKNDNIVMTGDTAGIWNPSLADLNIPDKTTGDELADILKDNYEVVDLVSEDPVIYTNLE